MLRLDAELNSDVIKELKKPLGKLYPDFEDAIEEIKASEFLISVGDATFTNLIYYELYPNLAIIDNLVQRQNFVHKSLVISSISEVVNPAGTITDNLWETIEDSIELAINGENQLINVEGEEDLAVLPCIMIAPENTIVLYGQPNEGLVLLNVSDLKEKTQRLLNGFIKE